MAAIITVTCSKKLVINILHQSYLANRYFENILSESLILQYFSVRPVFKCALKILKLLLPEWC